jgi:hypothetical protein
MIRLRLPAVPPLRRVILALVAVLTPLVGGCGHSAPLIAPIAAPPAPVEMEAAKPAVAQRADAKPAPAAGSALTPRARVLHGMLTGDDDIDRQAALELAVWLTPEEIVPLVRLLQAAGDGEAVARSAHRLPPAQILADAELRDAVLKTAGPIELLRLARYSPAILAGLDFAEVARAFGSALPDHESLPLPEFVPAGLKEAAAPWAAELTPHLRPADAWQLEILTPRQTVDFIVDEVKRLLTADPRYGRRVDAFGWLRVLSAVRDSPLVEAVVLRELDAPARRVLRTLNTGGPTELAIRLVDEGAPVDEVGWAIEMAAAFGSADYREAYRLADAIRRRYGLAVPLELLAELGHGFADRESIRRLVFRSAVHPLRALSTAPGDVGDLLVVLATVLPDSAVPAMLDLLARDDAVARGATDILALAADRARYSPNRTQWIPSPIATAAADRLIARTNDPRTHTIDDRLLFSGVIRLTAAAGATDLDRIEQWVTGLGLAGGLPLGEAASLADVAPDLFRAVWRGANDEARSLDFPDNWLQGLDFAFWEPPIPDDIPRLLAEYVARDVAGDSPSRVIGLVCYWWRRGWIDLPIEPLAAALKDRPWLMFGRDTRWVLGFSTRMPSRTTLAEALTTAPMTRVRAILPDLRRIEASLPDDAGKERIAFRKAIVAAELALRAPVGRIDY